MSVGVVMSYLRRTRELMTLNAVTLVMDIIRNTVRYRRLYACGLECKLTLM